MSGATPVPRLDDLYELADRTGHSMGGMPLATLQAMIRQGRLFRTDSVSKNSGELQPLGSLPEFAELFDEVLPKEFSVGGQQLRPAPELAGEFDTFALAGVFARLYQKRSTGRLFITETGSENEKVVIFQQGISVNAMSNIQEEWLGEVLISHGVIDQASFDEAVATKAQQSSRIGSALIHLEKLSPRELHRALSIQAMERLMNLFRLDHGSFRFVPDDTASDEEMLLLASPRDIIETGLATAVPAQAATRYLAGYGDPVLTVEVPPELDSELSGSDRAILAILQTGRPLSQCLHEAAGAASLTTAEARIRILTLMRYGVVNAGDLAIGELEKILQRLQGMHFFAMLDVRRAAAGEEIEDAFKQKCVELKTEAEAEDSEASTRLRQQIRNMLEDARRTLADDDMRPVYERALQLGLDFHQPEVRKRIEHEHLLAKGRSLLSQQAYEEARLAFVAAAKQMPDDPEIYVHVGWAQFLASAQDQAAAVTAVREVQRGLKLSSELAEAYLTIGKIHRIAGNQQEAENNLRRAIELDPRNQIAQSELRTLFARELGKKGGGVALDLQLGSDSAKIVAAAVVVAGLLFAGANFVSGGHTMWPDTSAKTAAVKAGDEGYAWKQEAAKRLDLRHNYTEDQVLAAVLGLTSLTKEQIESEALRSNSKFAREVDLKQKAGQITEAEAISIKEASEITVKRVALEKLAPFSYEKIKEALSASRKIPPEQQVMGNVEYYYLSDDSWWWVRRSILLILGLIGIVAINRQKLGEIPRMGTSMGWVVAAIPYGVGVGLLSSISTTSSLGTLAGMSFFNVLAEQVFFIWFVGYGLLKALENQQVGAVALTAGLFAAYQLTFFAVLNSPVQTMVLDVARIGAFIGGASAIFLWRSGGVVAPFLLQLALAMTIAVKTGFNG